MWISLNSLEKNIFSHIGEPLTRPEAARKSGTRSRTEVSFAVNYTCWSQSRHTYWGNTHQTSGDGFVLYDLDLSFLQPVRNIQVKHLSTHTQQAVSCLNWGTQVLIEDIKRIFSVGGAAVTTIFSKLVARPGAFLFKFQCLLTLYIKVLLISIC